MFSRSGLLTTPDALGAEVGGALWAVVVADLGDGLIGVGTEVLMRIVSERGAKRRIL